MIFCYYMLFVKSLNVRHSFAGMILLLLLAATVLGFNSLIPTAVASPIDDNITTGGGGGTTTTTMSGNTSLNLATTANVELEEEPFAVGHYTQVSQNLINETLPLQIVLEGGTTITLPNATEMITTIDTGEAIITALPGGGGVIRGQIQMITEDGFESAIADFTEYFLDESPTAISLVYFNTNSTGMLAPLNNMIAISLNEEQPSGDVIARYFEWKRGGGEMTLPQ